MQTVTFYHYQPSGDYVRDGPDSETEDEPQQLASIMILHKLEHLSDDSMSDDKDNSSIIAPDISMEEYELGLVSNPEPMWTSTKCNQIKLRNSLVSFKTKIRNLKMRPKKLVLFLRQHISLTSSGNSMGAVPCLVIYLLQN